MCVILYWLCVCVVLGSMFGGVLGWSCVWVAPAGDDVLKKRDCYEILV